MRLFKSSQGRQPFGTYIKLSCSALLISSVFVNYSSIENVHAETAENQSIDENHHKISVYFLYLGGVHIESRIRFNIIR